MYWVHVCLAMLLSASLVPAWAADWKERLAAADILQRNADFAAARTVFTEVLKAIDRGEEPKEARVAVLVSLGTMNHELGDDAEAFRCYRRALTELEALQGQNTSDYAMVLTNLAALDLRGGRAAHAEPLLRRAIATYQALNDPDDVRLAVARNSLAEALMLRHRYDEAEMLLDQAREVATRRLGTHERTAVILNNLAVLRRHQGRYPEALALFMESAAMLAVVIGPEHPHTARAVNNLAAAYADLGRYPEAEVQYRRAIAIVESSVGVGHPSYPSMLANYAQLLRLTGRKKEAKPIEARLRALTGGTRPNTDDFTVDVRDLAAFRGK